MSTGQGGAAAEKRTKCLIILSCKSSGSSVLQRLLEDASAARTVRWSRHFENETLYWTKAASVLGRPQLDLPDSEVPFSASRARRELKTFLTNNLDGYTPPDDDDTLIFGGWAQLCRTYAPILIEKSPHHLYQRAALELIDEAVRRTPETDYHVIGLVRDPMSTLHSIWRRWRSPPEVQEHVWLTAYRNLLELKSRWGSRLSIIRYEDLVTDPAVLEPVAAFLDTDAEALARETLHPLSVARWKDDRRYGYRPSEDLLALAERYGYSRADLLNDTYPSWPRQQRRTRALYRLKTFVKSGGRALRDGVRKLASPNRRPPERPETPSVAVQDDGSRG